MNAEKYRSSTGSQFLKAIADPVQGLNHIEFAVGRLEPLAQTFDVAVDGAVVDIDLIVVGHVHQGVPAPDHAWTADQRLQDPEFSDRQSDGLVLPGAAVALRIHAKVTALDWLGLNLLGGSVLLHM